MTRTMRWMLAVAGLVGVLSLVPMRGESADPALERQLGELSKKISALEARLKALEGTVQVSAGSVKIVSSGGLTLQSGGAVDIKGATLKLNGGGKPVARQGDRITVTVNVPGGPGAPGGQVTGTGTILEGSPTVSVP